MNNSQSLFCNEFFKEFQGIPKKPIILDEGSETRY